MTFSSVRFFKLIYHSTHPAQITPHTTPPNLSIHFSPTHQSISQPTNHPFSPTQVKPRGKIYSVNEGYTSKWPAFFKDYVNSLKHPKVVWWVVWVDLVWSLRGILGEIGFN